MFKKSILSYKYLKFKLGNVRRYLTIKKYQYSINPSQALTIFGENFSQSGNHFIIKFLHEHSINNKIDFIESSLGKFHKQFCPKTTEEAMGVATDRHGLSLFEYPWGVFGSRKSSKRKDPKTSRFCGPSSDKFIINEGKSIVQLFTQITKDGYQPTKYPNSFIQGIWMIKSNGEKRFVVLQGNHRMAVLAYLGYKKIDVRTDLFDIKAVKEDEINSWPYVSANKISKEKALEMFYKFF